MLELEDAQRRIVSAIQPLAAESVSLWDAAERVLAQPVISPLSLPVFDNSAMDGYAVRSADVASASANSPVTLKCVGAVAAGGIFRDSVEPQTCVRLFTGSPLPAGADAVVMQEDTHASGDSVAVLDAVKPWENVRLAGEDVKRGATIARGGERLHAAHLALIAATGIAQVQVARQPVIGILGTGDEVVEAGQPLGPGQIYESNRVAIAALVRQAGGVPRPLPLVRDSLDATRMALEQAFAECDAVVTTGGVSVGEHDMVKAAFEAMGGTLEFWKVAMRPGKPFVWGRRGEKFLFGLPGNPVSAFVTFLLLARPAILKLQGAENVELPAHAGILAEAMQNRGPRQHFMRVIVDQAGQVRSAGVQASHALSSLARANGLVNVPPETLLPSGASVKVMRWEW
jgi:molybdopterin molybdotransferase